MAVLSGRISQSEAVLSVELENPFHSKAEEIKEIHFRSLNGKCLKKLEARSLKEPGASLSLDYLLLSELSGIPESDIERMDIEDIAHCKEELEAFFTEKPKTLESYNQARLAGTLAKALATQVAETLSN